MTAMNSIPDIVADCRNYKTFVPSSLLLADALVLQISDLRSEVTGTGSEIICFLAQTLRQSFSKAYATVVVTLLERSGSMNTLIRRHAQECMEESIQYVHSGAILKTICSQFRLTKSKHVKLMCTDVMPIVLDTWPLDRYKQLIPQLGSCLVEGLKAQHAPNRDSCAKAFLAFEEEFPGQAATFRKNMDIRSVTLLEKTIAGLLEDG